MPFVFNNLNSKLETSQIEQSEQEARKLAALGKQLEENPEPAERLASFAERYGWMPPDLLAGLGIASLTNPALKLDDQEPFVADLVNAWVKNNKENSNRFTALTKGAIRSLFVGFDAAAERFIKRPIQAAGGVYTGEKINPTAALLDIIPGLGFTLVKGLGMTDMSYSEFFTEREKKLQQLGPTVGEESVKKLMQGERINLGSGFFGNSTLAEDTEVYKKISEQTQNPETLENARQLIQDQLGDPITVNERKRVNANSFTFEDGSVRPISPGLLLAHNVATPEDKGYNMLSGLVDGIFTLGLDPANLVGGYMAKAGRLKKAVGNPNVVKNRFITGRLARKMIHVPNAEDYLNSPAVREIARIGAKAKSNKVQRQLTRDQVKDPETLKKMRDATTEDEWIQAIKDYGLGNINKRFEAKSKFHADYKDGEKLLKASPEHFKQRRVVELYKKRFELFDDVKPTGNLRDYSIRIAKSIYNSPVYRASKDLPQTTLNTVDLPELGMELDNWMDFINAPDNFRNAVQDKMVGIIKTYNFRKQIAADFKSGILDNEALELLKETNPILRNLNLKREPSLVAIRSQIQDFITGDNKLAGIGYKTMIDGEMQYRKHTIFGWFDEWAENNNLPPMAIKMTRDLIANTNEGKRAYLTDRMGKPEFFAGTMTGKGTDAIIKNVQQETLEALPTASKLTEYLSYAITMPDPRELARYIGNVRNAFTFLATAGAKSKFPMRFIAADKRPGELQEEVAKGFLSGLGKGARNLLKYKITEEGIEQAALLRYLNGYMTKAWKPLALLRFAWTLRVVGEEQMRMWASDLDNVFTSPLSYFSYWFGDNAPMKTLAGNMQNAVKYKAAMSKGHGGFLGVNSFGRDRHFTTYGKQDRQYGSSWANNQFGYIFDEAGMDAINVATDLSGRKFNIGDATYILESAARPLSRKTLNNLLGGDQKVTIDRTVSNFLQDLDEGLVGLSGVSKYKNLDTRIEEILRRELDLFTQGFTMRQNQTFDPSKIFAKLMKQPANSKMFEGFTKNQIMEEITRVLDDYAITHSPIVKNLPIRKVNEGAEWMLDKITNEGSSIYYGQGQVGDVIAIPTKQNTLEYFIVDRVDTIKKQVNEGEEFALTLRMADEKLKKDGYTDSEINKVLGGARGIKETLTKSQLEDFTQDFDDLVAYTSLQSPIARVNRGTAAAESKLVMQEYVYSGKENIIKIPGYPEDKLTDISKVSLARLKELDYLAIDNAQGSVRSILYYGFGKNMAGKRIRKPKPFVRIIEEVVAGVPTQVYKPTKLGKQAIALGLVDTAQGLVQFTKNGSGLTRQAINLIDETAAKYAKSGVKLRKPEDIGAAIFDDLIKGDKTINAELEKLLRQEQLITLRPADKASFDFANDLSEQKVARVISGGQTGADIAGLNVAKELDIQTGGFLPRDFWTEDGRNYSLQGRFGAQPDKNPYGGRALADKGIVPKGPYNKSYWDNKNQNWVDVVDGEEVVLNYKEHAGKIKSLEYRSRAIKNVDNAHVTIIVTKAGVDSRGTKSTFEYATRKRWGLGRNKNGFIYQGDELEYVDNAPHKIFSNRVTDSRTDFSRHKDVVVINLDKFIADGGKFDPQFIGKLDNLLQYYDNPVVNIAGPTELKMTPRLSEAPKDKRKYLDDFELNLSNNEEVIKKAKVELKKAQGQHDIRVKEYKTIENTLHKRLNNLNKDSKLKFDNVKITLPPEFKETIGVIKQQAGDVVLDARPSSPAFDAAINELKKTWVVKDRTGKVIRKLEKNELKIVEEELKKANTVYYAKAQAWDRVQNAKRTIDSDGAILPFDEYSRLVLEGNELVRPFEAQASLALRQLLEGNVKTRYADTFENLVAKYTGPNREYFDELASDAFDNAREVKGMVAADDLLIESQIKGYLADIHLMAGGDYDIILRNKNDLDFSFPIEEGKTILKNKKDPSFSKEVKGINANLDEPITITVNGRQQTYSNVEDLTKNNSGFYTDFLPTKSIPTNPTGDKQYTSLVEMYKDGYYFDYNITKTGNNELLRVMAGVDPVNINYGGSAYSFFVNENMTHAQRRAYIKWLETKKHLGPTRIKGASSVRRTAVEAGGMKALDQATEQMFDAFMSGPTNMFSRSPAFYQFYMDKMRQLAAYADETTKKRIVNNFEQAWKLMQDGSTDAGLVRKLNQTRKDLWFDRNFRKEFLEEMQAQRIDDVFDINDVPKDKRYKMDFTMAPADNIYGEKTTTMDLVRANKRRSTTREWKTLPEVGDIISFSDNSNNRVLVRVTGVDSWDNIKGNTEKLTQWSKDEGWTMTYALKKAFFRNKDPKKVHQVKFEMYTDKVYTNFEEIDGIAKAYALEETKRLLYDLDKRGQVTDALRLVFPFGEAYKEILSTQFRLLKNNPQKLRKATIAIEGARADSIFGSDPNHNEGFFAKDTLTGEEMYNFADPAGILSGMVVGDSVDNTGVRLNMKGYSRNLNMMTTTILPGVGPVVQIPAAAFSSVTEFTKLSDFLFPYGRPEVRAGLAGIIDVPKAFIQASIPSYMKKMFATFSANPSGRADLEGFDPGSDPAGALASTTKDILKIRALAGTANFSSIEQQNAEVNSAVRAARGLTFIRAATQFLWFTGAEARYETLVTPEGAAFLDPSKTKEIDPQGHMVGINQLVQAYYKLYELAHESIRNNPEMASQDPQFIATQNFVALYGYNPVPLLIRKTREITEYPLGETGLEWARENKELFQNYPNTANFAQPYEPFDEFDIRAWRESISSGARVGLTPEQWIHLNNQANGRIAYTNIANEVDTNPNFAMWSQYQKNVYLANVKGVLYDLFPGFGSELTAAGPTDLDTKLRELRDWNKDSYLRSTEAGKALQIYLDYRDELMAFYNMQTGNNLASITGSRAIGIRNGLRLFANQLIIQYPEFGYMYSSILSRELEENERSVPDGFRILGQ